MLPELERKSLLTITLLLLWGKIFSASETLAVEYLAPDLAIVCRQCYYCSSDYLPNKGFVLTFSAR